MEQFITQPEELDIDNAAMGVEEENEEYQPFDPEKISIDTKGITMDTCLRRLEQGTIILAPDFQRNEVWTAVKKSRLIESLMLKIPLPMFYVSADEKGVFSVVDGLQRLSTIRSFVLGDKYLQTKEISLKGKGLKLEQLEFWGAKFDGLTFSELPVYIQNRILETEFTFTIINPGTPEEVKRNIFKRINTGGEPLTPQEIRHALYSGQSTILLAQLAQIPAFISATANKVSASRMMDRELILRFLAFTVRRYTSYPKNNDMDSFLSDTMRIINIMPEMNGKEGARVFRGDVKKEDVQVDDIALLHLLFSEAMERAMIIFGEHTFRKSYEGKRKTPINKALFEVWSVLLAWLSVDEFQKLKNNKTHFLKEYRVFLESTSFNYAISRDSWKVVSVKTRFEKLSELLNKYTND